MKENKTFLETIGKKGLYEYRKKIGWKPNLEWKIEKAEDYDICFKCVYFITKELDKMECKFGLDEKPPIKKCKRFELKEGKFNIGTMI